MRDIPESGQNLVIGKMWVWRRWGVRDDLCVHDISNQVDVVPYSGIEDL